jgi:hypothetical protein
MFREGSSIYVAEVWARKASVWQYAPEVARSAWLVGFAGLRSELAPAWLTAQSRTGMRPHRIGASVNRCIYVMIGILVEGS